MRVIDANALMDTFCNTFYPDELRKTIYFGNDCHRIVSFFEKKSRELILNAPTVDAVEVVHGRWKKIPYHPYYCSNCGKEKENV